MANNDKFITIRIKDGAKLPNGKGHVLVYDGKTDSYYSVTFDDLFAQIRSEMANTVSDVESAKNELYSFRESIKSEFASFKSDMVSKYNELVANYKDTSEKLILMVEKSKEN